MVYTQQNYKTENINFGEDLEKAELAYIVGESVE